MSRTIIIKHVLLAAIVALAVVNGIFSPRLIAVFALQNLWYPSFLPQNYQLVFAVSAGILATLHLMIAGIPAALLENFSAKAQPTITSRLIWLTTLTMMTIPSLPNIISQLRWV